MRTYELMYIVHPDLDDAAFKQLNTQIEGWVKDGGGKISKSDVWGKRKLAYLIRKQSEGNYVLLYLDLKPESVSELERQLRLQESVLRYLIVAREEEEQS